MEQHSQHGHRHGRQYYLSDIQLDEAIRKFDAVLIEMDALTLMPEEMAPLDCAAGRITASAIWAKVSSPAYDSSAMDGIAVRSRDTIGATETKPVRLKIGAQAIWVDTGDPIPKGFDAVIMVEVVHEIDEDTVEIMAPVPPYHHVRPLGEDIVATELVLPENHRIRPQDVAACASAGLTELSVRRRPVVTVIPTGTELVPIGSQIKPGDIIESNSYMLAAMLGEWGAEVKRQHPVPDNYLLIKTALQEAIATSDMVVINAGSSAGSEDYTARIINELGRVLVHGVAIKPGHPVILGIVDRNPVLGIPGYPVSAAVTLELFGKPIIDRRLGSPVRHRVKIPAIVTRKVLSPIGEDEFLRVRLGKVNDRIVATPIQRGSGILMSLVRADGIVRVPRFKEGIDAGEKIEVELLRPLDDINHTIVATGSHDLTLDILASGLRRRNPGLSLASSNVGSLGGLMALSRGEAHMAGCHLLEEGSGTYNVPYISKYIKGRDVVLINLVGRIQGLIVQKGNPKSITGIEDLVRGGYSFVNRQRGSGTRVLFDYTLKQKGISPDQVRGYNREEYTHLAVAAAVSGGGIDAGMGILAAARAMGLDFVPVQNEEYDLAVPKEFYESELLQPLLTLIRSDEFKAEVSALGGYDTSLTGSVVAEIRTAEP